MQQEGLINIVQELEIFLDVIKENTDSIMRNIRKRYESRTVTDEDNMCLSFIEEDVSEIEKATKVIRDKVQQIKIMVNFLC